MSNAGNPSDPFSRPPRPVQSAGRRWLFTGAALLALAAGWFVLARDGDEGAPTTAAPSTPVTTLPVPATTVTVPATAPTTATPTTTAAPTTALVMPTSDALLAALPTAADFPPEWTALGSGPTTDPGPTSGPRKGFCGGGDVETRAVATGMIAYAALPPFVSPDGMYVEVRLYGFPTAEVAAAFLTATVTDSGACPGGFSYQLPEGTGDGTYSGLGDEAAAAGVVWSFVEQLEAVTDPVADTDQAVRVTWRTDYSTVYAGAGYGYTGTRILQFERHGPVVVSVAGSAWNAPFGFTTTAFVPHDLTVEESTAFADRLRPGIVDRLRSVGLA